MTIVDSVVGSDLRVAAYASILDIDHRLQAVDALVARARMALASDSHGISLPEMVSVIDETNRQLKEAAKGVAKFEKLLGIRRQQFRTKARTSGARESATLRGSTDSMTIPELITFLSAQQKTGTLRVQASDARYLLELLDGAVVHAMSDSPVSGQLLGSLLVAKGKLSIERLEEFLETYGSGPGRIGTSLVKAQIVSEDDLRDALEEQVHNLFARIFAVEDATFSFAEGAVSDLELRVSLNATHLLLEGARKNDEWVAQLSEVQNEVAEALSESTIEEPVIEEPVIEEPVNEEPVTETTETLTWDVETLAGKLAEAPDDGSLAEVPGLLSRAAAALIAAGFGDLATIRNAGDEELLAVPGVGPKTVQTVRAILSTEAD